MTFSKVQIEAIAEKRGISHMQDAMQHATEAMTRLKLPLDNSSLSMKIQHAITMAYCEGAITVVKQHITRMYGAPPAAADVE